MILTKLEYLRRFTSAERVAIRAAAKMEPVLEDYMSLLELAEEINTQDSDTIAAVQMLESVGLISAGRANEILGPIEQDSTETALPIGIATVYRIGDNFMTCLATEQGPGLFDEKWDIDAFYYALIQAGATLRADNGKLAIAKQVG